MMQQDLVEKLRVVLVETSHPGNIGAVARAMKTMCLGRLYLVRPKRFPCAEATARAAGADDVLYRATVCESLSDALEGCGWVIGTSARARHIAWPSVAPRDSALKAVVQARSTDVALLFGRENSGLKNSELDHCHALVRIPTNPAFSSLNIAAAVQILGYELQLASLEPSGSWRGEIESHVPVSSEDMEGLYEHLMQALIDIGYLDVAAPKLLMRRLRRLFNRAVPDRTELNILRGILTAAQRRAKR